MAMNLFAHVLRNAYPGGDIGASFAIRPLDLRRWGLRDWVVRRDGFAPWGLANPVPAAAAAEPAAEPVWAETQPCWRE